MPMNDPRADADAYLEKHNVKRLFRDLGTQLAYKRPADPNAFMLKMLEEMQDSTAPFFTEDDVAACFAAFDPNGTGQITAQQYRHALKSLGVDAPTKPLAPDVLKVNRETFVTLTLAELKADAL
ncbi:hypothetical protein M885DRAFT_530079 [Pelagophyceae sp. CCMP2097]|nr:hypothetical protein M885DRAFT_530079 [Pelagophyceae sp. CCMP2097]